MCLKTGPIVAFELVVGFVHCFSVDDPIDRIDDSIDIEFALSFFRKLIVDVIFKFITESIQVIPDYCFYLLELVTIDNIQTILLYLQDLF